MAISRGVGPVYWATFSSETSKSATLNGTTGGSVNSIVIVLFWYDAAGTITPTINISGEVDATLIAGSKFTNYAAIGNISGQIAILPKNINGGNKTITVTFSAATYADVGAIEYAGLDVNSQPDNSASATGTTTATLNLTTTTANAMILAAAMNNSADFTAGGAYALWPTAFPNNLFYTEAEDDLDAGGTGSKTVDFTGFGTNWGMTAASFKAAGGAGTTPKTFTGTDSLAGGELL